MTYDAADDGRKSYDLAISEKRKELLSNEGIPLGDIIVGTRHRRDLGDVKSLAKSIEAVGLLHPVVITPDRVLIAGERRLAACKELGWERIPVRAVDLNDIVRGEYAENADRKPFLPSEIDAIRRAMEPAEKEAATERMSKGGKGGKVSHPSGSREPERVRDKIGEFAGVSGRTVEKIAKVSEAAEADPEKFGHLIKEMDETGKVDGPYRTVQRERRHAEIKEKATRVQTAVAGHFALIYADPPWVFETYSPRGQDRGPAQHYPVLTDDEIKAFTVSGRTISDIAYKDSALFMWCTSSNLLRALAVLEAWGFTYKTQAVWDKKKSGTGQIFLNQHEVLLYGSRGSIPAPTKIFPSVFSVERGRHSEKPQEVRKALERMYPHFNADTRIELFARQKVEGWTVDGYESQ